MTTAAIVSKLAHHPRRHLRRGVAHYRRGRQLLRTPASRRSRLGLDWTNFFIADVQTGFGTFVAFYLANLGWSQRDVGLALGVGGFAAVLGLIPGGALADAVTWKRGLVALGILSISTAALIYALIPTRTLVFAAEILHGLTAGFVTPAIAAISLGLVGRGAMSLRVGRNYGFAAAGTALTAGLLGTVGSLLSIRDIFLAVAGLCIPALIALASIRPEEIDYARARNAPTGEQAHEVHRVIDLARNHGLLLFAACLVMFQLANAAMLPAIAETLGATKAASASIEISGLIIAPQILVAVLAPWVGYYSEIKGRKLLLITALGVETLRAGLLATSAIYPVMLAAQLLDGLGGSIINVLTVLIIADLTTGTGRFNLAQGTVGAALALTASTSTSLGGFIFQDFGRTTGFLVLAAVFAGDTIFAWAFVPESKPEKYLD
jgi:predicted MFS family arabinose efflux permease